MFISLNFLLCYLIPTLGKRGPCYIKLEKHIKSGGVGDWKFILGEGVGVQEFKLDK